MNSLKGLQIDSSVLNNMLLILVIMIVLIIGICLWVKKRREDKQDEGEMTLTFQPETYETQQPEVQQPTDMPVDPSILETCRKRTKELFGLLEGSQKYIKFFDEDCELSGDGFMYSLMSMLVDGRKVWVIFYPNTDCDVIMLVFDREIPWNLIMENKGAIDEFYGNEGGLIGDDDDCPAYIWADGNGDLETTIEDLTRASQIDSSWSELRLQFPDEDDDDDEEEE